MRRIHKALPHTKSSPAMCNVILYRARFTVPTFCATRPIQLPLQFINPEESPALKCDGFIIPIKKHVECFIEEGVPIPDALEVECTGLVLKDIIRMDCVIFPDGVRPTDRVDNENFVVSPVGGGRSTAMADDEEEGEGGGATAADKEE